MTTLVATAGAANANSYSTQAEADEYLNNDRFFSSTAWTALSSADKDTCLKWATRELERLDYVGVVANATQALIWPRTSAYLDGRLLSSTTIPKRIKDATAELAFWLSQSDRSAAPTGVAFEEIKADTITLKFRDPIGIGGILDAMPDTIRGLIGKLTIGSSTNRRAVRR